MFPVMGTYSTGLFAYLAIPARIQVVCDTFINYFNDKHLAHHSVSLGCISMFNFSINSLPAAGRDIS